MIIAAKSVLSSLAFTFFSKKVPAALPVQQPKITPTIDFSIIGGAKIKLTIQSGITNANTEACAFLSSPSAYIIPKITLPAPTPKSPFNIPPKNEKICKITFFI